MESDEEKNIPLTKEDYRLADQKMKELIKGTKAVTSGLAANKLIDTLADISVTFCRQNGDKFEYGWFYTFVASRLVSGASGSMLDNLIFEKYQKKSIAAQNILQEEYDSFPITERQSRNPDKVIYDIQQMQNAANMYWNSRGILISNSMATAFLIGSTLYSSAANLPVIVGALAASSAMSYIVQEKLYKHKITDKEAIRKTGSNLDKKNREMITTSVERELSDPYKHENSDQHKKQNKFLSAFNNFVQRLNKYAIIGTAVKTAIVGGVIAATWQNPANMLVASTATMLLHGTVDRFFASKFSLDEQKGNFANAYRSFKSKVTDITFGKQKIPTHADTIELDHISFKHRNKDDITQRTSTELFASDETIRIGKGITFLSGASGAGKSTLLDLLKHSDDVTSGHIRIGEVDKDGHFKGTDYKDLAAKEQTLHIAFDSQKGKMNETTVNDFITRANPNASPELVAKVKELVGISDTPSAEANSGLTSDTLITDKVSGGEISRLKLAQTLIKDSPIMVLDEATTGVDTAMKENIINYINSIKDEKTIIWVTHMPDEIEKLDAYQAIDLEKSEKDKPAHFVRWDLQDQQTKDNYQTFFANRTTSSSSASPQFNEDNVDLDKILAEADLAADEYDQKAAKYQKLAEQARESRARILQKKHQKAEITAEIDATNKEQTTTNISHPLTKDTGMDIV